MRRLRGLWKIIFGRTTILVLLLFIQVMILFGGFMILDRQILVFNYMCGFLAVIILMYLLNVRQNSSFKLMWIIFILAVPVAGVTFYIYTRLQPGTRFISRRVRELVEEERPFLLPDRAMMEKVYETSKPEAGLFRYIHDKGKYPAYGNASIKYFPLGEDKFKEMIYQLERARDFIFLEYFIVERGHMWNTILDILVRKAREGVEVRFMYDGTCTLSLLPKNYNRRMEALGIKCKIFSPMMPFLATHQNNRDHRKILVIDGHTAFTGGVNLADDYINEKVRFGHWKDTAIMVKGKAVNNFTLMFLQMWNIEEKRKENYGRYMYTGEERYDASMRNGGYVVPYGDSPFDGENVGENVYLDILNTANEYVHIMTPYLILDEELLNAITFAAQRGVDVKIILPHIPDKKYAYWLARTHYKELITEGVRLYEYTPGFIHAKVFTSDDEKAVVGTINLDFRSLYLHFECAAYIWKNPVIGDIENDFQMTLEKCQKVTMENCNQYNIIYRIIGRALRLIAPLM
ncbi:MAG: cardiolipin synthase [Anaerovoracaceae bacterium]|nr:cardiolipin synthase [Anaerovoracaceae bacterium]